MGWKALTFLAEPAFVIPWYAFGLFGGALVIADMKASKIPPRPATRRAWPIIVFFFAPLGLLLYVRWGRGSGGAGKQEAGFGEVNASVIRCVAGCGLGIVSAMLLARTMRMTFWGEFWLEYAAGFLVGCLLFLRRSTQETTAGGASALALGLRAQFFSMLPVMGGMGAVMTWVTPAVVGAQPGPLTVAFWGFAMLGLLAGYIFVLPMSWLMLKVGWKDTCSQLPPRGQKLAWVTLMAAFGALDLALPEWLTEVRLGQPVRTVARTRSVRVDELHKTGRTPLGILRQGLRESLWTAEWALTSSRRSEATNALDAALRAAEVGVQAAPSPGLKDALSAIRNARRALQTSDIARAEREIHASQRSLEQDDTTATPSQAVGLERYADAPVVDARGVIIGEVRSVRPRKLELAIGGVRDAWGFFDLSAQAVVPVHESRLLFGPHRLLAKTYVMLPVNA